MAKRKTSAESNSDKPKKVGSDSIKSPETQAKTKKSTTAIKADKTPRLRLKPLPIDTSAHKFELRPSTQEFHAHIPAYENLGELPSAYGTRKLYLTARDPRWLYAYWDLSWDQFQTAEAASHDHKVFLQIYHGDGARVQQIHLHAHAKDWFIHVDEPDTTFYAEIGYYRHDGHFDVISRSGSTTTPRDGLSWKTHADFLTLPFEYSFRQLLEMIASHMLPGEELAEALARLEASGFPFPFKTFLNRMLTDEAHQALLEYLGGDTIRRIQMGSGEITEILRKQFSDMQSSGQWMGSAGIPGLTSGMWQMGSEWVTSWSGIGSSESVTSWGGAVGAEKDRNFFMHVNAELIIYGGTDPNAKVRIDGQNIQLRPDGTFSYHFIFKDGRYHIPIEATSPDGVETRSALLSFVRDSAYHGGVDKTPQPPFPEPMGRVS